MAGALVAGPLIAAATAAGAGTLPAPLRPGRIFVTTAQCADPADFVNPAYAADARQDMRPAHIDASPRESLCELHKDAAYLMLLASGDNVCGRNCKE